MRSKVDFCKFEEYILKFDKLAEAADNNAARGTRQLGLIILQIRNTSKVPARQLTSQAYWKNKPFGVDKFINDHKRNDLRLWSLVF